MSVVLEFIATYWLHIVIVALFVGGVVLFIINQRKNIKEWLLYAVVEAEKSLGAKMGKMKLRQVYDWFISTFPILSKFITFKAFSNLVDFALQEMKEILETNPVCKEYVER